MNQLPVVSITTAYLLSLFFSASYVGSLYISKHARLSFAQKATQEGEDELDNMVPSTPEQAEYIRAMKREREMNRSRERKKMDDERWRDDPDVIKARLVVVSRVSVVCVGVVWGVLVLYSRMPLKALKNTIDVLGLRPSFSPDAVLAHLLVPVLFIGPLYTSYLQEVLPGQSYWSWKNSVEKKFFSWVGIRNYLWAPLTEELVFRSCVLAVYHMSGASKTKMIFFSPLVFGLAHIHHAWDTFNRYGCTKSAMKRAAIGTAFQLLYTTLFGSMASYLFLRTGRIYPAVSSHVFCNIMGIPGLSRKGNKRAMAAAYVVGIAGFVYTSSRWTETPGCLFWK